MINVTLPDGSQRQYEDGASPADVAESISKSLAKAALAAKVNGEMYDLNRPLEGDAEVAIVTARDEEGLELIQGERGHGPAYPAHAAGSTRAVSAARAPGVARHRGQRR